MRNRLDLGRRRARKKERADQQTCHHCRRQVRANVISLFINFRYFVWRLLHIFRRLRHFPSACFALTFIFPHPWLIRSSPSTFTEGYSAFVYSHSYFTSFFSVQFSEFARFDSFYDSATLTLRPCFLVVFELTLTYSFRLGLFGFGASDLLREDNAAVGEEGVGNYGMSQQSQIKFTTLLVVVVSPKAIMLMSVL